MTFQSAKIIGSGISYQQYARQDVKRGDKSFVMSRGSLMDFASCPHKWIQGFFDSGDTKSTEWGSLIDCLVLTPESFEHRFAVCPETYMGKGRGGKLEEKPWRFGAKVTDDWKSKQGRKQIVTSDTLSDAKKARRALLENPEASAILSASRTQVMATADYLNEATGLIIPVKILLDIVPLSNSRFGKKLLDLKTCQSAEPRKFQRQIFDTDYDAQAALYTDVYTAATGEDRVEWQFILQENSEPYEVADPMPMLSSEFLDIGRVKYLRALRHYAQCLALNVWPSYSPGFRMTFGNSYLIEPEHWMEKSVMESSNRLMVEQPTKPPSEELSEVTV